jgi:hypothetical protein
MNAHMPRRSRGDQPLTPYQRTIGCRKSSTAAWDRVRDLEDGPLTELIGAVGNAEVQARWTRFRRAIGSGGMAS